MYNSSLVIDSDIAALERLLGAEEKDLGRSSFSYEVRDDKLFIEMHAQDATALKTVMNTIAKVLIVWEKSRDLK
jgi:tRNA threonylcarbamoyladenosine modification (KEOPS) complex  Pcc1 subunit